MKKNIAFVLLLSFFTLIPSARSDWPEAPWINGSPRPNAVITAIAFVSPVDLQFYRIMHVWKKLQKRYEPFNVDFLLVAMQEPLLPFDESLVETTVHEMGYTLPVLVDDMARYSKLWRAYVSPTVNLVLREGKVTSSDPGNFDPVTFEKTLQKLLKENGGVTLPPREYTNEGETKGCAHPVTTLLGQRFQKAWGTSSVSLEGDWSSNDYWIDKHSKENGRLEVPVSRTSLGVIARANGNPARVNVSIDGQKIPAEMRGHDVQEDKGGSTYFLVKGPRMYEILAHSSKQKDTGSKVVFSTEANDLRIWATQALPYCQDLTL